MANILVVYHYYGQYPPRVTKTTHLYCFRNYSSHRCYYLNLAFQSVPQYLNKIEFDIVIFQTLFFSLRWNRTTFERFARKARPLRDIRAFKIAFPQDEFINTDLVVNFINDFGVDIVFSVAPESEWKKIYQGVNPDRVKFIKVLTGYLDEEFVDHINRLNKTGKKRSVDIGYRSWKSDPSLGMTGMIKGEIAQVFLAKEAESGLKMDISIHPDQIINGERWFEFLLDCKYTLGVESGSSLLDVDGSLREKTLRFLANHPNASFSEIEAACFPGRDGELNLSVISPRHLEACLTRTCQILVEGCYNGILFPGKHFLPLKKDFSNLEHVLQMVKSDQMREMITEAAYNDIVRSRKYNYQVFVQSVLQACGISSDESAQNPISDWREGLIYGWSRINEFLLWIFLGCLSVCNKILIVLLPDKMIKTIKTFLVKLFH